MSGHFVRTVSSTGRTDTPPPLGGVLSAVSAGRERRGQFTGFTLATILGLSFMCGGLAAVAMCWAAWRLP